MSTEPMVRRRLTEQDRILRAKTEADCGKMSVAATRQRPATDITEVTRMLPQSICSIPDCSNVAAVRGWCGAHYTRWKRYGDPTGTAGRIVAKGTVYERLMAHVTQTEGGCWVSDTAKNHHHGYARINIEGKVRLAHVVSYELACGPVPAGLQIDHLCRVRACINPAHLEPVTPGENVRRSSLAVVIQTGRCRRGHTDSFYVSSKGFRYCVTCRRMRRAAAK